MTNGTRANLIIPCDNGHCCMALIMIRMSWAFVGEIVIPQKVKSHIGWNDCEGVTWLLSPRIVPY
jgi:hypothetical protein